MRTALTIVAVAGSVAVGVPAGRPSAIDGIAMDRLRLVYQGAWHLGLARGRLACEPRAHQVQAELRALVARDLDDVRRGLDTLVACAPPGGSGAAPANTIPADRASAVSDLDRLRDAYLDVVRRSPCPSVRALSMEARCRAGMAVGAAASRVACAIASWNTPLDEPLARGVRDDLGAVRQTLVDAAGLPGGIGDQIDALVRRLGDARGEDVYGLLIDLSAAVTPAAARRRSEAR